MAEADSYRKLDFVYTIQWHDGSIQSESELRHVAQIVDTRRHNASASSSKSKRAKKERTAASKDDHEADNNDSEPAEEVQLLYFYRPHQCFHQLSRRFHHQELLLSSDRAWTPISRLEGRCAVLNRPRYLGSDVAEVEEEDTFVCLSRYYRQTKLIKPLKTTWTVKDTLALSPRHVPRQLRRLEVLAHEAAVQSQMKMNQHDAHAIGSVKIEFVADKDIPVHVPNTTEEMPHLLAMSGQIRKMPKRREAPNAFTMTTDEDEGKLRFHMNALNPNVLGTPRKHAGSNAPTPKKSQTTPKTRVPASASKQSKDHDDATHMQEYDSEREDADEYFAEQTRKSKTSDKTLSQLSLASMTESDMKKLLSTFEDAFSSQRAEITQRMTQSFPLWRARLCAGFNLLFHGAGSKKNIIDKFVAAELSHFGRVHISGYHPSFSLKQVLGLIFEEHVRLEPSGRLLSEQVQHICEALEETQKKIVLIVHNIDGPSLRNDAIQTALSRLASSPHVMLIASIDHVNAPLVFDHACLARYKFVWTEASTFETYTEEKSHSSRTLTKQTVQSISGAYMVMKSLTRNGRKAFWTLLDHEIGHADDPTYIGVGFHSLLSLCQQNFAAHDENRLRAYLREYTDHQLVKTKQVDGVEMLSLEGDATFAKQLQTMMEEHFADESPHS